MTEHATDYELVIRPKYGFLDINWQELKEYRELLFFLALREIKIRYKQTVMGASWALLQPFFTMIVFTLIFGRLAKMPSEGIPYPIFSYSGLLIWTYFSNALSQSSNSLVTVIMLMTFLLASGIGYWLSSICVKYRDVIFVLPFFIQLIMFLSPVIYPANIVGEDLQWLLYLNPLTGIINAHRACILGHTPVDFVGFAISTVLTMIIFVSGILYLKHTEKYFADLV